MVFVRSAKLAKTGYHGVWTCDGHQNMVAAISSTDGRRQHLLTAVTANSAYHLCCIKEMP